MNITFYLGGFGFVRILLARFGRFFPRYISLGYIPVARILQLFTPIPLGFTVVHLFYLFWIIAWFVWLVSGSELTAPSCVVRLWTL